MCPTLPERIHCSGPAAVATVAPRGADVPSSVSRRNADYWDMYYLRRRCAERIVDIRYAWLIYMPLRIGSPAIGNIRFQESWRARDWLWTRSSASFCPPLSKCARRRIWWSHCSVRLRNNRHLRNSREFLLLSPLHLARPWKSGLMESGTIESQIPGD